MYCEKCGHEVYDTADKCRFCGTEIKQAQNAISNTRLGIKFSDFGEETSKLIFSSEAMTENVAIKVIIVFLALILAYALSTGIPAAFVVLGVVLSSIALSVMRKIDFKTYKISKIPQMLREQNSVACYSCRYQSSDFNFGTPKQPFLIFIKKDGIKIMSHRDKNTMLEISYKDMSCFETFQDTNASIGNKSPPLYNPYRYRGRRRSS